MQDIYGLNVEIGVRIRRLDLPEHRQLKVFPFGMSRAEVPPAYFSIPANLASSSTIRASAIGSQ